MNSAVWQTDRQGYWTTSLLLYRCYEGGIVDVGSCIQLYMHLCTLLMPPHNYYCSNGVFQHQSPLEMLCSKCPKLKKLYLTSGRYLTIIATSSDCTWQHTFLICKVIFSHVSLYSHIPQCRNYSEGGIIMQGLIQRWWKPGISPL